MSKIVFLITAVLNIYVIFNKIPSIYYQSLNVFIFCISVYGVFLALNKKNFIWLLIHFLIALTFNPIHKFTYLILDLNVAYLLVSIIFIFYFFSKKG